MTKKLTDSEKILQLLIKVTHYCKQADIPYYLGFYATRLALVAGIIPDGIDTVEIFVPEEYMARLTSVLAGDSSLTLENQQLNPDVHDIFLKIGDKNSTCIDILHPKTSKVPAYAVIITAVARTPIDSPENKKRFDRNKYGRARFNTWKHKPFCSALGLFPYRTTTLPVQSDDGFMCLLRCNYQSIRIPKGYFCGHTTLTLNGHEFSATLAPEDFLHFYYSKRLNKYPLVSKIDESIYIRQPNMPYCIYQGKSPLIIRIYGKVIRQQFLFEELVKRDFKKSINELPWVWCGAYFHRYLLFL